MRLPLAEPTCRASLRPDQHDAIDEYRVELRTMSVREAEEDFPDLGSEGGATEANYARLPTKTTSDPFARSSEYAVEKPRKGIMGMPEQKMMTYVNKKGKSIGIQISPHARKRFSERWKAAFPDESMNVPVDEEIAKWFCRAARVTNLTKTEKQRLKRHGHDTLFFRSSHFTFVVQDGVLKTVELSDSGMRHLNKRLPMP